MKKLVAVLLCIILCIGTVPVFAADAVPEFDVQNGVLKKYNGDSGEVVVPDGVTAIAPGAFKECMSLTGVVLPDSVVSIGRNAFASCYNLATVRLPKGITDIDSGAFYATAWAKQKFGDDMHIINGTLIEIPAEMCEVNQVIPNGVKRIGGDLFSGNRTIRTLKLPNGLLEIDDQAFKNCYNLERVSIPDSVVRIGKDAFAKNPNLKDVKMSAGLQEMGAGAFEGSPWAATQNEFVIINGVLSAYNGNGGHVVIPDGVTKIADGVFKNKKQSSGGITIVNGSGANNILGKSDTASKAVLTGVTIPDSVIEIGNEAFYGCEQLAEISMGASVKKIGDGAFFNCAFSKIDVPTCLEVIGAGAFERCASLTAFAIPESVKSIGESAFSNCTKLESAPLPPNLKSIGAKTFYNCVYLKEVQIPSTVQTIGDQAFEGCANVQRMDIPVGVKSIGNQAFRMCYHMTEMKVLSKSATFGKNVFASCDYLTLYGYSGTAAEISALENGIPFIPLDEQSGVTVIAGIAYASEQVVTVDGRKINFPMYALKDVNGNPTNYIKLRDLACILNGTPGQYNVGWDGTIDLTPHTPYTNQNGGELNNPFSGDRPYSLDVAPIKVNSMVVTMDAFVLTDDNGGQYTYFKLRDLGRSLGFNVGWDDEIGVFVETAKPYTDEN